MGLTGQVNGTSSVSFTEQEDEVLSNLNEAADEVHATASELQAVAFKLREATRSLSSAISKALETDEDEDEEGENA